MIKSQVKWGIGFKLVLFIGLMFIVVSMVTSIINYTKTKSVVQQNLEVLQGLTLKNVVKVFDSEVYAQKVGLENLAKQIATSHLSDREIVALLKNFQDILQVDLVYVGFESNGKNIRSNGKILGEAESYDSRTRGWYKSAKEKQGFLLTKPYKDSSGNIAVSFVLPIIHNNEFIGVVASDADVNQIRDDVLTIGNLDFLSTNIYDFNSGAIVFHNEIEKILTQNALSENIIRTFNPNSTDFIVSDENKQPIDVR